MTDELRCPVCGRPASRRHERLERVVHAGRDHGWSTRILTYVHDDGREHRVRDGAVFDERRSGGDPCGRCPLG